MDQKSRDSDLEGKKHKPILNFLQSFSAFIIGLVGLSTAIYQFVQLFLGDRENFTLILGGLGYLTVLASLIHIGFHKTRYLTKTTFPPQWFTKMTYEESYEHARKGLILLLVATLIGGGGIYAQDQERQNKFVIMVAEFDGPESQNYRITEKLLFRLNESLSKYNDVLVIPLNKVITEQDGSTEAQKISKKYRADLLIWGWYGLTESNTEVTIHIENLSTPKNIVIPSSTSYATQSPVAEINNFHLQQKMSDEMAALSFFISGVARYENEDYHEAIKRLTAAYEIGDWPNKLSAQSMILFFRGNAHLHNSIPKELTENDKQNHPEKLSDFTLLPFNEDEVSLAVQDFSSVIQSNPTFVEAYINRGEASLLLSSSSSNNEGFIYDEQSPLSDFNKALELSPNNLYALNERGMIYLFADRYSEAITDFSKALEIGHFANQNYPLFFTYSEPAIYTNRGIAYERNDEYEKAIQDYKKALDLSSTKDSAFERFLVYSNMGNCYNNINEPDKAIEYANKALDIYPSWYQAYHYRGDAYNILEQYQSAISDYSKAIEFRDHLFPKEASEIEVLLIRRKRGDIYLQIGDYENAINDFSAILDTDSIFYSDPETYENRGVAFNFIGEEQKAEDDFAHASDIYLQIGINLAEEDAYDQALEYFDKAIMLTPNNAEVYLVRATVHLEKMEIEHIKDNSDHKIVAAEMKLAFDDAEMAIQLDPEYAEAYFVSGTIGLWIFRNFDILVASGNGTLEDDFLKVLELSNDPELRKDAQNGIDEFWILVNQRHPQ